MLDIVAPCLFGLESVLSFEATRLGFTNVRSENGRVMFNCELEDLPKANIGLRTAERVLICLAQFEARSFEELFQGVKKIDWQEWIGKCDKFPVKGYSINSKLHSVPDCQSIIKKAVVNKLSSVYGISWFEESDALYQIQFSILKDNVCIMLDTSGTGLYKRGYRLEANDAPIKETIAAGLLDLARYKGNVPFYDPMCGSGTFVIEAALRIKNAAPGLKRKFTCEEWKQIPKEAWSRTRYEMLSQITTPDVKLYGSDIDPKFVAIARENAKRADVDDITEFNIADIRNFSCDGPAVIVTNPPYGERMLDIKQARELYKVLGSKIYGDNKQCYIISPDDEFESHFGHKADKKRKIYNGMIRCDYYQYFKSVQK